MPENQYWWVNQNQTYQFEVHGGYMWSPKTNTNGARNQFYDNMTETNPGDVVFSFKDTYIKAIGVVTGPTESCVRPTEIIYANNAWDAEGWLVPVEFKELDNPLRPKDHMNLIGPTLPPKYSPLQSNGNGLQSVYLAAVPPDMAHVLNTLLGNQVNTIDIDPDILINVEDDNHEHELITSDIPETEKLQLINSRRGQGLFKTRVRQIENNCRVTGISTINHLTARHIKPWRFSSPFEKLDGNNGLLLSPHIDHLFDRGYISFAANGSLLVSSKIQMAILVSWGIDIDANVGTFRPEQEVYMEYHRTEVFKA